MKNTLAERILSRAEQHKPEQPPHPQPVTPLLLHLTELDREPLPLPIEAAAILAELRPAEPLPPERWLELAEQASRAAVATFPPERQNNTLKSYVANNCKGRPAPLIAAHAVALHLWARRWRAVTIGKCHAAACEALGLEPESIVRDRVIPERVRT